MTDKPKPEPEVRNPRYAGATPEMVGRALLRRAKAGDGEEGMDASPVIIDPAVQSST